MIPPMQLRLTIGDFSRMSHFSVKALRHYHEIDLLKPVAVDPDSGDRLYDVDQVPVATVIRRLKDLGMSLDDVRRVLQAPWAREIARSSSTCSGWRSFATAHSAAGDVTGFVLCVSAALACAVAVVVQKPVLASVPPFQMTWLAVAAATIACLIFTPTLATEIPKAGAAAIGWTIYLGAVPTALGFATWTFALRRASAGRTASLNYLIPVVAILLGWALLAERPQWLAELSVLLGSTLPAAGAPASAEFVAGTPPGGQRAWGGAIVRPDDSTPCARDPGPHLSVVPADLIERYLLLGLRLGRHIDGFVDAYYGPPHLAERVKSEPLVPPSELAHEADILREEVRAIEDPQRARWLSAQLDGIAATAERLDGRPISYVDEIRRCYGVAIEPAAEDELAEVHRRLDELMPGKGSLRERYLAWRRASQLPRDSILAELEAVNRLLRASTAALYGLPHGETVELELVSNQPWGGFNYYLGGLRSRVVMNTDIPIHAQPLATVAAHEAYPGHHTEHAWKETLLVLDRGYLEESTSSSARLSP